MNKPVPKFYRLLTTVLLATAHSWFKNYAKMKGWMENGWSNNFTKVNNVHDDIQIFVTNCLDTNFEIEASSFAC